MNTTAALPPGSYFISYLTPEGRMLTNPVTIHPDGYATLLGTRWTPVWVEAMQRFNRLRITIEASEANERTLRDARGPKAEST